MNASQYDSQRNASTTLDHPAWSRPRTMAVQGKASAFAYPCVRPIATSSELDQLAEEPERWDGLS